MAKTTIVILSALIFLAGCAQSKSSKSKGEGDNLTLQSYDFKTCPDLTGSYRCKMNGTAGSDVYQDEPSKLYLKQVQSIHGTPILETMWDGVIRTLVSDGDIHTSTRNGVSYKYSIRCSESTDEIFVHTVGPDQYWTKMKYNYSGPNRLEVHGQGVTTDGAFDIKMDCY